MPTINKMKKNVPKMVLPPRKENSVSLLKISVWRLPYITKSMITNDIIKPDFLPPIKNLTMTHKPNAIINERNNGKNMSCNGTSWILYWNMTKTGNSEKRKGCKTKFFNNTNPT